MREYNPKYDMPPRIDRFINKHPRWFALIVFVLLVGVLSFVENI